VLRTNIILLAITSLFFFGFQKKEKTKKASEFQKSIECYGLKFTLPEGYKPVAIKGKREFEYEFAIRNKRTMTELRYSIYPFAKFADVYSKCATDPLCLVPSPDKQFREIFFAGLGELCGGPEFTVRPLSQVCYKKLAGADTGDYCNVFTQSSYRKYPFTQVIHLQKKEKADVIVQILSMQTPVRFDTISPLLQTLTFVD
jgi:hypothetical protein